MIGSDALIPPGVDVDLPPSPSTVDIDGGKVNVWQIQIATVTEETVSNLAVALGFDCAVTDKAILDNTNPNEFVVTSQKKTLALHRKTGTFQFRDETAYERGAPTPSLLSDTDAQAAAGTLLQDLGLLPPSPHYSSFRVGTAGLAGTDIDRAVRVLFVPQLQLGAKNGESVMAPVRGAEIAVDVGDMGAITKVSYNWRPVENAAADTTDLAPTAALEDILDGLYGTEDDAYKIGLVYSSGDPGEVTTHLAPFYDVTLPNVTAGSSSGKADGGHGTLVVTDSDRLRVGGYYATRWMPEIQLVAPDVDGILHDGANPIDIEYTVQGNQPPYEVRLVSQLDGELEAQDITTDNGNGAASVVLHNGRHDMRLWVADARGANAHFDFPLFIHHSALPDFCEDGGNCPGSKPGPPKVVTGTQLVQNNGLRFELVPGHILDPPQASPIARKFSMSSTAKVSRTGYWHVEMEQWRYMLAYSIPGESLQLVLRSNKCKSGLFKEDSPFNTQGCGACDVPSGEFATTLGPTQTTFRPNSVKPLSDITITNQPTGSYNSTVTILNLPGDLTLFFRYEPVITLCAPDIGGYRQVMANWAPNVWQKRPLGLGRCPGFVPRVDWRYIPPQDGVPCETLQKFCKQNKGVDADGIPFCSLATINHATGEIGNETPVSDAFIENKICQEANYKYQRLVVDLYTVIVPHTAQSNAAFAKVSDESPVMTNTLGIIDRTKQPFAPTSGDLWTHIRPIPQETVANFSTIFSKTDPNDKPAFDDYHGKRVKFALVKGASKIKTHLGDMVAFLGCNDLRDLNDNATCTHIHERWSPSVVGWKNYEYHALSPQRVDVIALKWNAGEMHPNVRPERLVGVGTLGTAGLSKLPQGLADPPGTKQLFWLRSRGQSDPYAQGRPNCDPSHKPSAKDIASGLYCRTNLMPLWVAP